MFSLLNNAPGIGKSRARMGKILNFLSPFFGSLRPPFLPILYLFDGERLTSEDPGLVGPRIASWVGEPVFGRIPGRKD